MSVKSFPVPRGTSDILPEEAPLWQALENKVRKIFQTFNYREIRTPFFEETDLFARSMGQTSDVVQKQMLNLTSQRKDSEETGSLQYSLRPENTASVVRSYIENSIDRKEQLTKLFYIGPMFRGERPQKGRLRQFHQVGVEVLGPQSGSPYLDADVISLAVKILSEVGIKDFHLKINTLGSREDKEIFSKWLRRNFANKKDKLCPDCQDRLERNVFRILDCKNKDCKALVEGLNLDHSFLSEESQSYFKSVLQALDQLEIQYEVSPSLVRGLDYYTHTVFEISSRSLGSQDALGAGGRYNHLVEDLGGPSIDAIGFALGVERMIMAMPKENNSLEIFKQVPQIFLIALDEKAYQKAYEILNQLRNNGISSDMSFKMSSMKSQMRLADKLQARFVMILGEDELKKEAAALKNMQTGDQKEVAFKDIQEISRFFN